MKKRTLYTICILLLFGCSNNRTQNNVNIETVNNSEWRDQESNPYLDSTLSEAFDMLIVSCGEYAYFDRFLRIPYNGCLYNPSNNPNNKLGLADIILTPKKSYEFEFRTSIDNYVIQDSIVANVNRLLFNEIKTKFSITIFLIEKKYLQYIENAEINYYPNLPYTLKMFEYNDNSNKWCLSDSAIISIGSDGDKWVKSKLK